MKTEFIVSAEHAQEVMKQLEATPFFFRRAQWSQNGEIIYFIDFEPNFPPHMNGLLQLANALGSQNILMTFPGSKDA